MNAIIRLQEKFEDLKRESPNVNFSLLFFFFFTHEKFSDVSKKLLYEHFCEKDIPVDFNDASIQFGIPYLDLTDPETLKLAREYSQETAISTKAPIADIIHHRFIARKIKDSIIEHKPDVYIQFIGAGHIKASMSECEEDKCLAKLCNSMGYNVHVVDIDHVPDGVRQLYQGAALYVPPEERLRPVYTATSICLPGPTFEYDGPSSNSDYSQNQRDEYDYLAGIFHHLMDDFPSLDFMMSRQQEAQHLYGVLESRMYNVAGPEIHMP